MIFFSKLLDENKRMVRKLLIFETEYVCIALYRAICLNHRFRKCLRQIPSQRFAVTKIYSNQNVNRKVLVMTRSSLEVKSRQKLPRKVNFKCTL